MEQIQEGSEPSQDTVPVEEATDEELDAFLEEAGTQEEAPEEDETAAPVGNPPQIVEQGNEPASQPQAGTPKPVSQEEHQRILKQLEQAKLWAARRSTEIGDLRKQLRDVNARLSQNLNEVYETNPVEGTNRLLKIQENERRLQSLDQEEASTQELVQAQQIFFHYVKPDEVSIDEMCDAIERVGLPPEYVSQFKRDPFRSASPDSLVFIAKLAKAEKLILQALGHIKKQSDEISELKKKPEQVLTKAQQAMKQKPQVTAASGGSASKKSIRNLDVTTMSDAELEELLRA